MTFADFRPTSVRLPSGRHLTTAVRPLVGDGSSRQSDGHHQGGHFRTEVGRTEVIPQTVAGPITLRPYQRAAVEGILASFRAGHRSTLLELPTGAGKTVVFAAVARLGVDHGRRILVLAHRTELLAQAAAKLRAAGMEPALEQGDQRAGAAPLVVASVQTLRGARLARFAEDAFDLIVIDEAPHATAASYTAILDRFASARVLGVTATPDRADGEALGRVFASVAYRYELRQAIRDGWLAPIRARRVVVDGVDLSTARRKLVISRKLDLAIWA